MDSWLDQLRSLLAKAFAQSTWSYANHERVAAVYSDSIGAIYMFHFHFYPNDFGLVIAWTRREEMHPLQRTESYSL